MKSPFPGMDPYLEQHWRDIHSRLIIYACDQMQAHLPGELFARVEERVYVESEEGQERSMYPDVRVVEHGRGGGAAVAVQEEIDIAEPCIVHLADEPATETYLEILDASTGNRVVTVIEFLSQTNKFPGPGQDQFLQKQIQCRGAGVNLVLIDLLRGGQRVFGIQQEQIPSHLRLPYQAIVWRGRRPTDPEFYGFDLRKRLPGIRIPLRKTDADIALQLQPLIDQCYCNGRYDTLNYVAEPEPPLSLEDAAWAEGLLREAGRRK